MGMSAGADQSELAAGASALSPPSATARFLGGPPLVGFLGNQFTVLRALTVVAILLAMAIALAPPPARRCPHQA